MRKILTLAILLALTINIVSINIAIANHTATVAWSKEAPSDSTYPPHPGAANEYYWNGYTPKWINFTVKNDGPDPIREIKIIFKKDLDGNSYFNFTETRQKTSWYATPDEFGPNKRPTVLYFRTDSSIYYIQKGETARFDIFMTEGPKSECSYNIDVWTVDAGSTAATTFHELFILIDNHLPTVQIIYPNNGTIFQDPEIVWVNATASDTEGLHPSGIKKVELWFTYIEKTGTSKPTFVGLMKYDSKKKVYWWKTKSDYLRDEAWHKAVAIAYDYAENKKESEPVTFFWYKPASRRIQAYTIDQCFLYNQPVGHVGSNVQVKVSTGFLPNHEIICYFSTLEVCRTITDNFGAFSCTFNVPEMPRGLYKIKATDNKITNETDFTIIPWVWINPTEGYVDDEVTLTGKGFAANFEMDVVYRDISLGRYFDKWALEWDEGIRLEWKPQLDNLTVTPTVNPPKTDTKGTFTFKFKIPQSYGGYHPIYAEERKTKVRSGWMPDYPQAALFKVKTKIWTTPTMGLSGQFIQIFGEGLPLPEYTDKIYDCKTKQTTTQEHDYYLVIDFGPNKYWVFEKGFILNNEFDYAWLNQLYLPFAYRFPREAIQSPNPTDPTDPTDPTSPVWKGKLCWLDADKQYHIGSPFLKVPALMHGKYNITLYQFDATTEKDSYKYVASTSFQVFKDPLYVRVNSGTLYFSGENVKIYTEIDLDGTATDPTVITFRLYLENTFLQSLSPQKIATGLYTASFTCPNEKGNYFIIVNATSVFEGFSLSGFGTASFTVSSTLDGFNATLTAINGTIATVNTKIGEIQLNLSRMDAAITSIKDGVANVQTNIGLIRTDFTNLNARITNIESGIATVQTNLGEIKTELSTINGGIISLSGDTATIKTDVGTIITSLDSINAQVITAGQNIVTIKSSVGDLQGKIASIDGKTATISTNIGDIYTRMDSIKTETGLQPTNLALSLIAAIAAIIAAILIFRKLYS